MNCFEGFYFNQNQFYVDNLFEDATVDTWEWMLCIIGFYYD